MSFLLPKREKSAEDSAASLRLFAFELLMRNLERVELHVPYQVGVYKPRNACPVESNLPDKTREVGQRWAKERTQRQSDCRCVLLDSTGSCFPRDPSLPSVQSHTTVSRVYWRFQWTKSSARRIHVFLKVFSFGGAQLGVVSAQFRSE